MYYGSLNIKLIKAFFKYNFERPPTHALTRTHTHTPQGAFPPPLKYPNALQGMRQTIQKQGFKYLYKGLNATCLKMAPAIALQYVLYEELSHRLGVCDVKRV